MMAAAMTPNSHQKPIEVSVYARTLGGGFARTGRADALIGVGSERARAFAFGFGVNWGSEMQ